jgi:hypothetical protein
MSDTTNAVPTADAPSELKSNDTRDKVEVQDVPAKPEVVPKPEAKPESNQDEGHDDTPEGGEEPNAPAADSHEGKRKRLPRWMQERLERERQVTEARTREQMLREFQEKNPAPKTEDAPSGDSKTWEQLLEENDFDYSKATKALVKQGIEEERRQEIAKTKQQEQAASAEKFKAKIDAFEEKAGDGAWEDILTSPLNQDPKFKPLVDLFLGDEKDLELAHHFAKNPKDAQRLIDLPRLQMVREVAKLAEQFSGEQVEQTPAPIPKKTTNAPPPPKTVSGAGKPSVDLDSPDITPAQRIAEWKRRGSK